MAWFNLIPREEKFYDDFEALAAELKQGALLLEIMSGDPRAVPADREGFAALLAERGITPLPNPPMEAPAWFGPRTD